MSLDKFKPNSSCVDERPFSGTIDTEVDITKKNRKVSIGNRIKSTRPKSTAVKDNTFKAERLGRPFKIIREVSAKAGTKLPTNVLKNRGRSKETGAIFGGAAVCRKLEDILSTLLLLNLY